MKKKITLLLMLCMIFTLALAGCGSKDKSSKDATVKFTDSLGREVEVPENIERVAVSGPLAQIPLFALCPDKLVGVATPWSEDAAEFIDEKYMKLPELGQLYGGKGELNLETLLESNADVIIDIGEAKEGAAEDMDKIQEQTGIPFVHIDASLSTMGDAYKMLGDLLGMKDEAEKYAKYYDDTYSRNAKIAEKVEKKKALYITGPEGHNVIAKGSFHGEVMDILTENLAVVDEPSSKGTGNEVGMEQILAWDPDYIIFAPDSIYDSVSTNPEWKNVKAIKEGHYYKVPMGPDNWMGYPPSAQRIMGMTWLADTLYHDEANINLKAETKKFYEMFYHAKLTDDQYKKLVGGK